MKFIKYASVVLLTILLTTLLIKVFIHDEAINEATIERSLEADPNITVDHQYKIYPKGKRGNYWMKAGEFTPKSHPGKTCIVVGHSSTPGLFCFDKYKGEK